MFQNADILFDMKAFSAILRHIFLHLLVKKSLIIELRRH